MDDEIAATTDETTSYPIYSTEILLPATELSGKKNSINKTSDHDVLVDKENANTNQPAGNNLESLKYSIQFNR